MPRTNSPFTFLWINFSFRTVFKALLFPKIKRTRRFTYWSLILLTAVSCNEASDGTPEKGPAMPEKEAGMTSAEAYNVLLGIVEKEDAAPTTEELVGYFPALNFEHTLDLAQECIDHSSRPNPFYDSLLDPVTRKNRVQDWRRLNRISHEIFARLGQLNHSKALRFLNARSPAKIEAEGHPMFFPEFLEANLISILHGWAKSDPEGAIRYAMALVKQENDDMNWTSVLAQLGDHAFAFVAFREWTKQDEKQALDFLKSELTKPWIDESGASTTEQLRLAAMWVENALRAFCRECEFEVARHTKAHEIEELFEHFRPVYRDESRKWGFQFYLPHVEIATRWRRQDFTTALSWWMDFEKERPESRNDFHLFRFFQEGSDTYTKYEATQILNWLEENPERWGNVWYFGVIFSYLEGADQTSGLDLICSLPEDSLRATFLANLIFHPTDSESGKLFYNTAYRRQHLAPVNEVQNRIEGLNLKPSEIDQIVSAIEKRRELDRSQ